MNMLEALRAYIRNRKRLRNSMRELARNGYHCVQLHGNVTLAQRRPTRFFGY